MSEQKHTPGPWYWEINPSTNKIGLYSAHGCKQVVIEPRRWGMNGATVFACDLDRPGLIRPIHETAMPFPRREHHSAWARTTHHPDLLLIAAAPDLLEACKLALFNSHSDSPLAVVYRAAIAKAEGKE